MLLFFISNFHPFFREKYIFISSSIVFLININLSREYMLNEIERFKIPIDNIKALSKINGFSASSTIKIYIQSDAPMKLVVPIGSYGTLKVLLRSCS